VCYTQDQVREALARTPDAIVQTKLSGDEFTVDALIAPDGRVLIAVPRWRVATRGGISTVGLTFELEGLSELVGRTASAVGLTGPLCLQGFYDHDTREIAVTEINPRFSGGLPLSLAAGADLIGGYLALARGVALHADDFHYRPGVKMIRSFREHFEYTDEL
jgi:carbamoyl-phosphate synthase large subunit